MVAASLVNFGKKMAFRILSLFLPLGISFDELCRCSPLRHYADESAQPRSNKVEITIGHDFWNLWQKIVDILASPLK
jgi:hypothetical protein